MALPKLFFSFFFLLLLSSSLLHVNARDSQFFSKVTKKIEEEVVQVPPKTEQLPTSTTSNFSGDTFFNTKFANRGYTTATTTAAADVPYGGESGESNAKNNYKNDASVTGSQGTEGDSKISPPTYPTAAIPSNPSCHNYPC